MEQDTSTQTNNNIAPTQAAPKSYNKLVIGLLAVSMAGNA